MRVVFANLTNLKKLSKLTILSSEVDMPTSKARTAKGGAKQLPARRPSGKLASIVLASAPRDGKPLRIPVGARTLQALAARPGEMKALLETYGAAVAESRRTGRPMGFVVDVGPQGEPKIGPVQERSMHVAVRDGDLQAALEAARQRGRARVAEILSGDDMLSADAFAELIGTSRVTVNAKRQAHQVLGLEGAKRGFRFPNWQIGEDGKPFSILPALFDRLAGDPWAVYRFLVQHHPELEGLTGREALQRGRSAKVLEVAESVMRAAS
jgi:hypothetical protein